MKIDASGFWLFNNETQECCETAAYSWYRLLKISGILHGVVETIKQGAVNILKREILL